MSDVRVKINFNGVRQILKSDGVVSYLEEKAKKIQQSAGSGFETSTFKGKNRANVSVYADSREAQEKNLKDNTLLKALNSAR